MYPFPCRGSIYGTVGSFQSEWAFTAWRALTVEILLMSVCGQGHETEEIGWKGFGLKFPVLDPSRSRNTDQIILSCNIEISLFKPLGCLEYPESKKVC